MGKFSKLLLCGAALVLGASLSLGVFAEDDNSNDNDNSKYDEAREKAQKQAEEWAKGQVEDSVKDSAKTLLDKTSAWYDAKVNSHPESGPTEIIESTGGVKAEGQLDDGSSQSRGVTMQDGAYIDYVHMVMSAIIPFVRDWTVDAYKEVIVKTAETVDAMGAVDSTAMNLTGSGEGKADSPAAAVEYSVALLENVEIDVDRWIDMDYTSSAETTGQQEDDYKKEILARRMELARQYANAGVYIAEGMNTISADFPDRGELLQEYINSVSEDDYASAIGAVSDVAREDLIETLRSAILSTAELGVSSSQVLLNAGIWKKDE